MKIANISFKRNGYVWLAGTMAVCVVMMILFYNLILDLQLEQREQAKNQLQMANAKLAAVEKFAAIHPDTQEYLRGLDAEVARLDKLLPDRLNMGETLAFLEDTAKETGVVCGALATEKSVFKNGWTETGMVFKVLGSYSDLMKYTRRLESGPRFMTVKAVEFHDRNMLDNEVLQRGLDKALSNKAGAMVKMVSERGLLTKESLVVMNVYLMVASEGRLTDAEVEQVKP
ncbi:MAG: Pilus assembly protein, PilO [Firmicutes bacterium]|nr:Pilus assembly protein, PilO [Bacillota bacterium]